MVCDEGEISGFLVACCREPTRNAIILRIAVHPEYRNRGVATKLIETAIGKFQERELLRDETGSAERLKNGISRLERSSGVQNPSWLISFMSTCGRQTSCGGSAGAEYVTDIVEIEEEGKRL